MRIVRRTAMLTILNRVAQQRLDVIVIAALAARSLLLLNIKVLFFVGVEQMLDKHVLLR